MLCALALVLSSCAAPAAEPERMGTEGRLLLAENGTALLIAEDGTPITLSVQAEGNDPWAGYHSGDRIRVLHDGVNETYPGGGNAGRYPGGDADGSGGAGLGLRPGDA